MSQAERGLFDQISDLVPLPNWPEIEDICIAFELAYSGLKNALEHERKSHHAAQDRIVDLEQRLAEAERDKNSALDLLSELFDKYENGDDCYEEPEENAGYIGKAFKLEDETFDSCVELLNRLRPVTAPQQEQK